MRVTDDPLAGAEADTRVVVYLDDDSEPLLTYEPPVRFELDTSELADGPHRLRIEAYSRTGEKGIRTMPFTVRNGPAVAVSGMRDEDVLEGRISLLINSYGGGEPTWEPSRAETPAPIPSWAWALFIVIVAFGAFYGIKMWKPTAAFADTPTYSTELAAMIGSGNQTKASKSGASGAAGKTDIAAINGKNGSGSSGGADVSGNTGSSASSGGSDGGGSGNAGGSGGAHVELSAASGKQIVMQGGSQGATACVACHGVHGSGRAAAGFPMLGDLTAGYMVRQLKAFRTGERQSPVMAPIAKALTEAEIKNVTEYYAGQNPEASKTDASAKLLAKGRHLALDGDWPSGIPSCVSCHAPGGQGVGGPYFPALAGQHASYIVNQIKAFKSGQRTSDPINLMTSVAKALTEEQTKAVAAYFASLPTLDEKAVDKAAKKLAEQKRPAQQHSAGKPDTEAGFTPPSEASIPDNEFGKMVRLGRKIFADTQKYAGQYVGNGLNCVNCHINEGRLANSAPLWGAWPAYPTYRGKNDKVNTMIDRIQGCFTFSMNGTPPPGDSKVMTALMAYTYWLAQGTTVGNPPPGRGYPDLPKPDKKPSSERGATVYQANCAMCHGADGHGKQVDGQYVFPPLWGPDSYNWGAGMHRITTAAQFIHANMPFGRGGEVLSVQQAWDVAAFVDQDSHSRPPDPRSISAN